jgi:TPR repeat protein
VVPQVRREPGVRALLQPEKKLIGKQQQPRPFRPALHTGLLLLLAATALPGLASIKTNLVTTQALAEREYRQAVAICRHPQAEGIPLYRKSRSAEAIRLLRSAAEKGHVPAMIHLGSHYLTGNGVDRSARTAFQYYSMAVKLFFKNTLLLPILILVLILLAICLVCKTSSLCSSIKTRLLLKFSRPDSPKAQYEKGLRYLHGKGIQKQVVEARRLFERAAAQNYAPAQVQIGLFFKEGLIVQESRVKATEWFQKAAEQGDAEGLFMMGKCHEEGAGVPLYLPKALGFYLLAASKGHRDARHHVTSCEQKLNNQQQQAGQQFAKEFHFNLTGAKK